MFVRNRRGNRHAGMKARLAVASAVLAGGAAIGAMAVAASSHPSPSAAQSAGYTLNLRHSISAGTALSTALSGWTTSQQKSVSTLAEMAPFKNFVTARHGKTEYAAQRGVVVLATKHWLLVKSSNGPIHLWLINAATKVKNVAGSVAGTAAMTGSKSAATAAASHGNTAPAAAVMAGTSTVTALNNPVPRAATFTVTVAGSGETITITITPSTATVTPSTMTVARQTGTSMKGATQATFTAADHVRRGDLVFVAGVENHGQLRAQLVLFIAPVKKAPSPAVATPSPASTVIGTHS
jgi:hypothetical protein